MYPFKHSYLHLFSLLSQLTAHSSQLTAHSSQHITMSLTLHERITIAEAQAWLAAQTEAILSKVSPDTSPEEFMTEEFIVGTRPQDFKYRKPRISKKSSGSESERSQEEYNEELCDARVWVGGHGGQCSRKKADGCRCCKTHQKAVDQFGLPKEGFINEFRPDYHYNDESKAFIPWKDSSVEKPNKGRKKSDKARNPTKCSICGEIGHNKRKCPEVTKETHEEVPAQVVESVVDSEELEPTLEMTQEETPEETPVEEPTSPAFHPDEAAGTGVESEPEPEADEEELVDCTLEGIEYVYEKNTMIVRDADFDQVGMFKEGKIVFDKASGKMHAMKVAAM